MSDENINAMAADVPSQPSCVTYPNSTYVVGEFGEEFTIYMNRASPDYTHTVNFEFGSGTDYRRGPIGTGITDSVRWSVPLDYISLCKDSIVGSGVITVYTFSGSTRIGVRAVDYAVRVPENVKPSGSMTISDATGLSDIYGGYIRGLSKLNVSIIGMEAYLSPITGYSTVIDGVKYTSNSFTTDILQTSGELTVSADITDARGRVGNVSQSITVYEYSAPKISAFKIGRCNADGSEYIQGEYIKVTFSASATSLDNQNSISYAIRYKKSSESDYTLVGLTELENIYSVTEHEYIFAADTGSSYDIEVIASDNHYTTIRSTSASTAFCLMHWGANGTNMGIGRVSEKENYLEIGLRMEVDHPIEYIGSEKQLLPLTIDYKCYADQLANQPWCRKNAAGVTEVRGIISPINDTNTLGTETGAIICTLPEGYRPGEAIYRLCQGEGACIWTIMILPSGEVIGCRNRAEGYQTPGITAWMPFHFTFFADQ